MSEQENIQVVRAMYAAFGRGDIPGVLDTLEAVGFAGLVCVELSRDSHRADQMVPQALGYLRSCRARAAS